MAELSIQEDLIKGFIPYIDTMKSILIHNGENDQSLLDTFLNIIELKNKLFYSHKLSLINTLKYYNINIKINAQLIILKYYS